ncbi:PDC sensor domain-containing protein, partial [Campylobacter hyointestinalis]|uniref:PDC sensor domain-containing protein n=1 Tax=Campylobacter hyointestinalis TaxID=198 RepID=UPI00255756AB
MKSISGKVSIIIAVIFAILLSIVSYVNYTQSRNNSLKLLISETSKILEASTEIVNNELGYGETTVEAMAKYIAEHGIDDTLMLTLTIVNDTNGLESTYFGSEINGNMYSSGGRINYKDDNFDVRKRPWYQETIEKNRLVTTEPYPDLTTGKMVITTSQPVYKDSKLMGVMAMDLLSDDISKRIFNIAKVEGGYLIIINKDGKILMHPNKELVGKQANSSVEIANNVKNKKFDEFGRVSYKSEDGIQKLAKCAELKYNNWQICTARDTRFFEEKNNEILLESIIMAILSIIITTVIVLVLIKKMLSPIQTIGSGLKNFFDFLNHKNNNPKDIKLNSNDEFGVMAKMINENINLVK